MIVGFLTLILVAWGVVSVKKLPIDAVPDITNNQVQVITVSPSLAAPEGLEQKKIVSQNAYLLLSKLKSASEE